jgi:hypothetical protein
MTAIARRMSVKQEELNVPIVENAWRISVALLELLAKMPATALQVKHA